MKWIKRIFECLLIVAFCALVGYWIGLDLGHDVVEGKFVDWEPVPLPNELKAKQFVTGSEPTIYSPNVCVATEQDELFVQHLGPFDGESDWEKVDRVNAEGESYGSCSTEDIHQSLQICRPPGTVVAQLDCEFIRVEPIDSYRYVILDNGEVWRWKKQGLGGWGQLWLQVIYSFGFAVVGGIVGLVLFVMLVRRQNQSQGESTGVTG